MAVPTEIIHIHHWIVWWCNLFKIIQKSSKNKRNTDWAKIYFIVIYYSQKSRWHHNSCLGFWGEAEDFKLIIECNKAKIDEKLYCPQWDLNIQFVNNHGKLVNLTMFLQLCYQFESKQRLCGPSCHLTWH